MPNYEDYLKSLDYKYNNAEEIINNRIAGLEKNIEELTQNVNRLTDSEKRLKTDIENADKSIKEKNQIIKGQKETIDNLEDKRQYNEKEIKNLNNKIITLDKNLLQLQTDSEQNTNKQKLEISRLLSEQSILQNENNDLNNQLIEAKKNYDSLFKDIGKTSDSANELQQQIKQLQSEKEKERIKLNKKILKLNKTKAELEQKLVDSKNGYSSKEFNKLKEEKDYLFQRNINLTDELRKNKKQYEKELNSKNVELLSYKSNIKPILWILGIACVGFLSGMIYSISEKNSWKRISEYDSYRYYMLDNLIEKFSENTNTHHIIGEIDFYNSHTETYDTIFKNSEITFIKPRIKEFYSLKKEKIEISYKRIEPSGWVAKFNGDLKDGVKDSYYIFDSINCYARQKKTNIHIGNSVWGKEKVGNWSIGKYEFKIYLNGSYLKSGYLTVTDD